MKKVLMMGNSEMVIYNFRYELIKKMIDDGYEVYISLPYGPKVEILKNIGCRFIDTEFNGRKTNIAEDIRLFIKYIFMIKKIKPDIVLTYTVKPNTYGGIASRINNIPYVCNVTGLGSGYLRGGMTRKIISLLSALSFRSADKVFFQNSEDMKLFVENKIVNNNYGLLPGSGVNITKYRLMKYPDKTDRITFSYIGRIMKDKGINEYLEAAEIIRKKYKEVDFNIIGAVQEISYKQLLKGYEDRRIIKYYEFNDEIIKFIENTSCIINPSYSEGMSNVLLESASCGRPIIASNIPGCKEIINEGINGYTFECRNTESLVDKIEKFINISYEEKVRMGLSGRSKAISEFDRNIVVDTYIELIESIGAGVEASAGLKPLRI